MSLNDKYVSNIIMSLPLQFCFVCTQVYGGAYRRQIADVTVVDNFEGVLAGSIVAVNLVGNYRPPHLAKAKEATDTSFIVKWFKGGYKSNWVPWCGWTSTQIPKESVMYFDIELDEKGKLKKEAAQVCLWKFP